MFVFLAACIPEPDPIARFPDDLRAHLVIWYEDHGVDATNGGGNTLPAAQDAVSRLLVTEVLDAAEDPLAHDLVVTSVFRHPDVVWPGSDTAWFGAYERETGALIEIYDFN